MFKVLVALAVVAAAAVALFVVRRVVSAWRLQRGFDAFAVVPMREFSDEGEPLTEREELRRFMVRVVSFVIAVLLIHYFLVPNPLIEDVERALTWSENVNTVTVYDTNGVESSTLSGNCYIVGDSKVNTHGGSRPGPLAIRCYDGDVVVSYRVVEGASVTLEKSGGSFGFEEPRATIREAGSSVAVGLSESGGRGGV